MFHIPGLYIKSSSWESRKRGELAGCLSCERTAEPLGASSVRGSVERALTLLKRAISIMLLPTCPQKAHTTGWLTPRAPSPVTGELEPGTAVVLVMLVSLLCTSGGAQSCSADEERHLENNHRCTPELNLWPYFSHRVLQLATVCGSDLYLKAFGAILLPELV